MSYLAAHFRERFPANGYDLVALFSRFEYAMKKGGFRQNNRAAASWRNFANKLPENFFTKMQNTPEAKIFFEAPPDHLEPVGDSVEWSGDPKMPQNVIDLFDCIRVVRNNLFHGDKRRDNHRDEALISAAIFILQSAYEVAVASKKFQRFVSEMEYWP